MLGKCPEIGILAHGPGCSEHGKFCCRDLVRNRSVSAGARKLEFWSMAVDAPKMLIFYRDLIRRFILGGSILNHNGGSFFSFLVTIYCRKNA